MNREIKFRVWCNVYKEMKTVEQLWFWGRATIVSGKSFEDIAPVVDYELMQFTGLLDKYGKEIYEGDVVSREVETWNWESTRYYEVVFEEGWFCLKRKDSLYSFSWHLKEEVIGNVFENPELLSPK